MKTAAKKNLIEKRNGDVTDPKYVEQVDAQPQKKKRASPFVATWRVEPDGYQWIKGAYPEGTSWLEFIRLADDRLQPWVEMDDNAEETEDEDAKAWKTTRWLVPVKADAPLISHPFRDEEVDGYDPLRHLNLHRDFAALDVTGDAILAFANKYGWLGLHIPRLRLFDKKRYNTLGYMLFGEEYDDWVAHIMWMRSLLILWDYLRDEGVTVEEIQEIVVPDGGTVAFHYDYIEKHPGLHDSFSKYHYLARNAGGPYDQPEDEPFSPLLYFKWLADSLLRGHLTMLLGETTFPAVDIVPGSQLHLVPKNLLGAMYIMFLQEVMGKTVPPIRCAACGKWFSPRAKKDGRNQRSRKDREYCSNACKQVAYRVRVNNRERAEKKEANPA